MPRKRGEQNECVFSLALHVILGVICTDQRTARVLLQARRQFGRSPAQLNTSVLPSVAKPCSTTPTIARAIFSPPRADGSIGLA